MNCIKLSISSFDSCEIKDFKQLSQTCPQISYKGKVNTFVIIRQMRWWKHSVEHSSEIKVPFDQNGTACGVIGENSLLKGNPTILGSFPEQKSVSFPTRRFLKFTGRIQRFIAWSACDKSPRFMEHSCSLYQGLFSHSMKMTHQCKKIN